MFLGLLRLPSFKDFSDFRFYLVCDMSFCYGIFAATCKAEHGSAEEVEHGELDGPAAGIGVNGEENGQMGHEDGDSHIAHHDDSGHACPGAYHNQYGSYQFGCNREVGDEAREAHAGQHALDARDTIEHFMNTVEEHEPANGETEKQQT